MEERPNTQANHSDQTSNNGYVDQRIGRINPNSHKARMKRPTFELTFQTEANEYQIVHDTRDVRNSYATESILNFTTKNSMGDDSSAFSIVLMGDVPWENMLNSNDLVILKVKPNELTPGRIYEEDKAKNEVVTVGLISEVRIEGTYGDDKKLYRITGQSFQKAFMNFELKTIQQVSATLPSVGWMDPDLQVEEQVVAVTNGVTVGGSSTSEGGGTPDLNNADMGTDNGSPINPVRTGSVSSGFGPRVHPVTGQVGKMHYGLDFASPTGTPVYSVMGGVVYDTGFQSSAGNYVMVWQNDNVYAQYYHLSSISVNTGQTVNQNDVVGRVGNTGSSTGPHLHFGIATGNKWGSDVPQGTSHDPADYLGGALGAFEASSSSGGGGSSGTSGGAPQEITKLGVSGGGFTSALMGKSVRDVAQIMLERFLPYMKYNFSGQGAPDSTLDERFTYNLDSWTEDEFLVNPVTFTSFEGSFNQLMMDITSKPFNEMFFDVFEDDDGMAKAIFYIRRTPFDEDDWNDLKDSRAVIHSEEVISEEIAQSDLEVYSLFNLVPEDLSDELALSSAKPYYNEELVKKYGYKMLEVSHKFIGFKSEPKTINLPGGTSGGASGSAASIQGSSYSVMEAKKAFEDLNVKLGTSQAEKDAWAWISELSPYGEIHTDKTLLKGHRKITNILIREAKSFYKDRADTLLN